MHHHEYRQRMIQQTSCRHEKDLRNDLRAINTEYIRKLEAAQSANLSRSTISHHHKRKAKDNWAHLLLILSSYRNLLSQYQLCEKNRGK